MKKIRIKDICDKGSSSLKQKDVEGKNGLYSVFGASGQISSIDFFHQEKEYIAIVKDGSGIGRVSFMPAKSSVIGTMQYIIPKPGFDIRYVGYCLQSLDLSKYKQGAAIPHIYFKDYGEREVSINTNIKEQQKIVDYLDNAFEKIDQLKKNAEQQLAEAKALFQASLKSLLEPKDGWAEMYLKDIAEYSIGLTYKPVDVCENGTIVLRSSNIQDGKLDLNDIVKVNTKIKESLYVQNGDILMCSRNGSSRLVGKVCMIPDLQEKMTYGTFMMIIRSTYNPLLYHFFDTNLFRSQIKHGEANMINQITRYMLDEVKLNLPPISEQHTIVAILDEVKSKVIHLQSNYDKICKECDALKQAILREVFE